MKLEWKYDEEMNEYDYIHNTPEPPRRVPYTAETWPAWAVWVRRKNWGEGERQAVGAVRKENISVFGFDASYANLAENYEISGIDGIWRAASREVTP